MDIEQIFEHVISIDREILKVYQEIIINEYQLKPNDENINKLKSLIELENWAYSKIDLNYEKLNKILIKIRNDMIGDIDVSEFILRYKSKSDNQLEDNIEDKYIKQIIFKRIEIYLSCIHYLHEQTEKNILYYIGPNSTIEKNDDITDIYLVDSSFLPFKNTTQGQYIKESLKKHKVVLAFDTQLKKQLEIEAKLDIDQLAMFLFNVKTLVDGYNRYFYLTEIYYNLFQNKKLEERFVNVDFNFDELYSQISTYTNQNQNCQKFLTIHREQYAYMRVYDYVEFLLSFKETDFINNLEGNFNIAEFNIYLEYLKAHIGVMRYDELETIRITCHKYYGDIFNNTTYGNLVSYCLSDDCYNTMQSLLNADKTKYCKK